MSMLLPWYAAGTLDAAERARVERALAADAGLRAELALVQADRAAARELAEEVVPASMAARFDALFEQQAAVAKNSAPRPRAAAGLLERLRSFITPPQRLAWAAAAAVLVVAAQAGVILTLLGEREAAPGFSTASGPQTADGPAVLVRFVPERTAVEIEAWLTANGGRIVDGPLPGGLYRVRFERSASNDAPALAKRLASEDRIFALVLPAQ